MLDPSEARKRLESLNEEAPEAAQLSPKTVLRVDVTDGRGKRYQGNFPFRVPTIGDQVRIGQLKAVYLPNGAAADPNAAMLVEQMCYLEACLEQPRPAWWQPTSFYDTAPITALYKEALDYERKFLSGDKVDSGLQNEPTETGKPAGNSDSAVVGEVQSSAERPQVLSDYSAGSR